MRIAIAAAATAALLLTVGCAASSGDDTGSGPPTPNQATSEGQAELSQDRAGLDAAAEELSDVYADTASPLSVDTSAELITVVCDEYDRAGEGAEPEHRPEFEGHEFHALGVLAIAVTEVCPEHAHHAQDLIPAE